MRATFLGTGNFLAPGRYWNSFVLDGRVLVEPAPTARALVLVPGRKPVRQPAQPCVRVGELGGDG